MRKHILVVEDELEVAKSICIFLRNAGFRVSHLERGDEVELFYEQHQVSLIVLDVMLPGLDGMEVCRRIRTKSDVPIFILTACSDESQRLSGLKLGADDYICKPFSAPELVVRIQNFLRRFDSANLNDSLILNKDSNSVSRKGNSVTMTKSEIELVMMLKRRPNQAFTREQILDGIYSDYRDVTDRTVDTHIKNIRKKLKIISPNHEFIQAVYGVGYRFVREVGGQQINS
ncbi:response regulator [Glaciecola sp. KUL10]|uniref:response regulator n=1 Tax=Glaciecola sp. (strain KUL10) TaxID=2161813 RepID=UPI001314049E|nr:response regulator [Glaciecola sp. KUL10]